MEVFLLPALILNPLVDVAKVLGIKIPVLGDDVKGAAQSFLAERK